MAKGGFAGGEDSARLECETKKDDFPLGVFFLFWPVRGCILKRASLCVRRR